MIKQLTVPWEPKGDELFLAQVDDICGKRSALVTKRLRTTGATHTSSYKTDPCWQKNDSREVMRSKKAQVSNSSMRMSWGAMGEHEEGMCVS